MASRSSAPLSHHHDNSADNRLPGDSPAGTLPSLLSVVPAPNGAHHKSPPADAVEAGSGRVVAEIAQVVSRQILGRPLSEDELMDVLLSTSQTIAAATESIRLKTQAALSASQPAPNSDKHGVTPPELARRWGVKPDKVLGWIRSGELAAINLAENPAGRPRYLIEESAIEAFASRRASQSTPATAKRPRRQTSSVTEFF